MKKLLVYITILFLALDATSQNNVGINNLNPQFPLSFNGAVGDKISLWTDGTSTHYGFGIQNGLLQVFTKTINDDVVFGFGSSTTFTERMRVKGNGNVGIGTNAPYSPLSFPTSYGEKISFFGNAADNCGIGVQPQLMQIHADDPNTDIAFGWGSTSNLTELMRIRGNGWVGIGVIPSYRLDVNGRMRIRSGGNNAVSAGLWMNNNSNVEAAFIGMQDDTHVGFFGNNGAGWKFTMNTQTGALQLNGSDGNAGQVIQSNGTGAAATWASSTNTLYNNTVTISNTTLQLLSNPIGSILLAGMTYTFSVSGNAKVLLSFSIPISVDPSCDLCNYVDIFLNTLIDGTTVNQIYFTATNGQEYVTNTKVYIVGPGTHTISLNGTSMGGPVRFGWGGILLNPPIEKQMTIQVIPQ